MTKPSQLDRARMGTATVLALFGLALLGWAALLFLLQCFAWLKTGVWQPVPMYAVFLSPALQMFMVGVVPPGGVTPLALAPSLGGHDSLEAVARALVGSAEGAFRIVSWLFSAALAAWLIALAIGSFFVAGFVVSHE